jgi:hypothetical protein
VRITHRSIVRYGLYFMLAFNIPVAVSQTAQGSSLGGFVQRRTPPPPPTPVRDSGGIEAVRKSVQVLGGERAITTIVVQGVSSHDGTSSAFVWKDAFSPWHELRRETTRDGKPHVFVSGHGHPRASGISKQNKLWAHTIVASPALHCPAVVLSAALKDSAWSIELLKSDLPGFIHIRIGNRTHIADEALTTMDWYFDLVTLLPRRVEYHVPNVINALEYRTASLDFDDFKDSDGVLFPFSITATGIDKKVRSYVVSSVDVNIPIAPSAFELDGGGQ